MGNKQTKLHWHRTTPYCLLASRVYKHSSGNKGSCSNQ